MPPKDNILNRYLSNNENSNSSGDYFSIMRNMVKNLQDSPEGKKAVQSYKEGQRVKKGNLFAQKLKELQDLEEKYDSRLEYSTSRGADEGAVRKALDKSLESKKAELRNLGMLYRNQGQYGDEVFVEDPSDYRPHRVLGFARQGNIVMPQVPVDPVKKMMHDMTMAHERGHAKRMEDGTLLSFRGDHWHEREEEQQAVRDSIDMIKENMERAGIEYNPNNAFRLLAGRDNLDYIKNPSMSPFINRMEYLPTEEDPAEDTGEYLKKLKEARLGAMRAGLDITAPPEYRKNMRSLENINHYLTKWQIANES